MRIAVINEVSACKRNADILAALAEFEDMRVMNVGMTDPSEKPELTYIQTGLMAGVLIAEKKADLVIGGCGTGQGFLNAAMQFPGVFCGLITNPLDAWLFSQINAGNCVSLALNKGYGWAGDINLRYIIRELLRDEPGAGYPSSRGESQRGSRLALSNMSLAAHKTMTEILETLDQAVVLPVTKQTSFMSLVGDTPCGRILLARGREE